MRDSSRPACTHHAVRRGRGLHIALHDTHISIEYRSPYGCGPHLQTSLQEELAERTLCLRRSHQLQAPGHGHPLHIEAASRMADPAATQGSPATDTLILLLVSFAHAPKVTAVKLLQLQLCRPFAVTKATLQTQERHNLAVTAASVCESSITMTRTVASFLASSCG
jgi:hypothetical protein